jgi:hypothetical protein
MTVTRDKPQIHEVVLAPLWLWHHMVYVGFLAIFQVLMTARAEPLLPLKKLALWRRRGLGAGLSLSPRVLEGRIIWEEVVGTSRCRTILVQANFSEGGMTHFIQTDPAVLPGTKGVPPVFRGSPPA